MCSANKKELCSVAGFTNEDPKKVPPHVGRFLLIEACDRHNRSLESRSSRLLVALQ
jgi:hypothetical protein